jgi:hypothetical protein
VSDFSVGGIGESVRIRRGAPRSNASASRGGSVNEFTRCVGPNTWVHFNSVCVGNGRLVE